jgi:nucleoid-associated protein YgaU
MTSAGKLIVGTVIITAAVATAKYLHKETVQDTTTMVEPAPAERLTWRAAPLAGSQGDLIDRSGAMRLASAEETTAPPPFSPLVDSEPRFAVSVESSHSSPRPPLPFSINPASGSGNGLTMVDDEESAVMCDGIEFVHHTVQFGETLQQIAVKYTGRQDTYMSIYQANLDILASPTEISPGIVLKIPVR